MPPPTPPLSAPIARRLEQIRKDSGIKSARAFWLTLGEFDEGTGLVRWRDRAGQDQQVSYPAVKNYLAIQKKTHEGHRDAPAFVLARVADVFGYRLEWLVTGGPPRTHEEGRRQERFRQPEKTAADIMNEMFIETEAGWLLQHEDTRWRLAEVFGRWCVKTEEVAESLGLDAPPRAELVEEFAGFIARPIMRWHNYRRGTLDVHDDRLRAYVDALLLALSLATPDNRDFRIIPHLTPED